jgi:hypothetical protein
MAAEIVKRSRGQQVRGAQAVAICGPALAALAFFALPSALYAAQSPFSGNTIRAKYFRTTTRCAKIGGECQITDNRLPRDVLIYISTKGRIFEYGSNNTGDLVQLGKRIEMPSGDSYGWTMQGNVLTRYTILADEFKTRGDVTFTAVGNKCTVSEKTEMSEFTFRNDIEVQSCEILQGHVER